MSCRATFFAVLLLPLLSAACDDDNTAHPGDADSGDATTDGVEAPDLDVEEDVEEDAGDLGGEPDSLPPNDGAIAALTMTENPANVLSYFVEWRTIEPVVTLLDITCGPAHEHRYVGDEEREEHRVFVMGLWEGAECDLVVWSQPADGETRALSSTLTVGQLPDNLPDLEVVRRDPVAIQPGWTLFNLSNQPDGVLPQLAIIDSLGRYRWYHQRATTWAGADIDAHVLTDGVLMGGNVRAPRPAVIDWQGNVTWEGQFDMHHEIRPYRDSHLLYLGLTQSCGDDFVSDDVIEIDPADNSVVWRWRLCEHYTPEPSFDDWSHTNSAVPFSEEDALLLSVRNQNSLLKLDLETESIVWVLGWRGRPSDGFRGDFAMAEGDRFYQQHAPEIQSNGNILVFDNGMNGVRSYSRAIEIAIDEVTMTAEVVWEYRHDPDIFADTWSDADRLANGNTLIAFGVRSRVDLAHIVEVTPAGEAVWDVVLPVRWSLYRAERIVAPIYGEVL